MEQLEVVFGLFVVLAVIATLARRIEVPYPILLVMGGLVIGLVPGLPRVEVDPNLILLVFLPPLLYAAALAMPPRELRDSLRPISLLAFGLVLFTMTAVAVAAHATIDGLSWAAGFTLGAIVSPPDPVAAVAIANRLGLPRRLVTILEGEGLFNDVTALVVYRLAVAAVVTGSFSLIEVGAGSSWRRSARWPSAWWSAGPPSTCSTRWWTRRWRTPCSFWSRSPPTSPPTGWVPRESWPPSPPGCTSPATGQAW